MTETYTFCLYEEYCDSHAVDQLLQLANPRHRNGGMLDFCIQDDVNVVRQFFQVFSTYSMLPLSNVSQDKRGHNYRYDIQRAYTDSDFARVDFLYIWGIDEEPWSGWLTPDGQSLILTEDSAPKRRRLSWFASLGQPLCVESIKQRLEREQFIGLKFRPAILMDKPHLPSGGTKIEWADWGSEPWYQIISDVRLPPLAPTMDLRDVKGQPARERGVWPKEGSYSLAELHYLEKDVRAVKPFDVAMTHEMMYGYDETFRRLIVSQRFYQLARELGLAWEYLPVRLDGEAQLPSALDSKGTAG